MYQIFIVEDELLIRQSIRNVIEKMPGPYALCGEASDGEMALAMMQDLMPDILITDIRMPFLDGFGLIKNAKAMMPWLKIVIISGFGDFESAQKAISLGVDQYLLKPVRQADLIRVVEEMAAQIEKSRSSRGSALPDGMDEEEVLKVLRQHFMRQLLYDEADTEKLLDRMQRLKMDIMRKHYLVAVCSFDSPQADHRMLENAVLKVLNETQTMMVYFNNADRMTVLAFDNDPDVLNERVYRFINILRHELQDICPVITTVISSDVQRIGEISEAYKKANGLLKTVSGIAAGQVLNARDTAQISANMIRQNTPFYDSFSQMLRDFDNKKDAEELVNEIFRSPADEQFNSRLMRYNALIALVKIAVQMISRAHPDVNEKDIAVELSSRYDILNAAGSKAGFRETAKGLIETTLNAKQADSGEIKNHHVISQAEQYLKENFCDPNISLISVANHVAMSAAYFSTVFSQTTGRSFITYLTALRVERAKELLRTTNMKLADIALEIGYSEPNYFSHVFRKTVGITPKEYRILNQK
ncbi:MAG: helix-turn-helix domain-containing protein [Anaerolineaceae bacterium]|nr:helix-turn-helix domain-containing protein [Anaerolineaceae bacterium]